jgi:hypothetical protein
MLYLNILSLWWTTFNANSKKIIVSKKSSKKSHLDACKKYYQGANFLRCIKILSQHHSFLSFLPSPFLPCKDTFMDDYDGI